MAVRPHAHEHAGGQAGAKAKLYNQRHYCLTIHRRGALGYAVVQQRCYCVQSKWQICKCAGGLNTAAPMRHPEPLERVEATRYRIGHQHPAHLSG